MKTKLSLLAFMLLPLSAFAVLTPNGSPSVISNCCGCTGYLGCGEPDKSNGYLVWYSSGNTVYDTFSITSLYLNNPSYPILQITRQLYTNVASCPVSAPYTVQLIQGASACSASPCPAGSYVDGSGACISPPPPLLSNFDNNPDGCHGAGGLIAGDGRCLSNGDFAIALLTAPTTIMGGGLLMNGWLFGAGGIAAAALFPEAALAATAFGTIGFLAGGTGLLFLGKTAGDAIIANDSGSSSYSPPSMDVTTNTERIKVSLIDNSNGGGVTASSSDLATGKVKTVAFIPSPLLARLKAEQDQIIENAHNNVAPTVVFQAPDSSGVKQTDYNYDNMTATTQTVLSDGSVKVETTPIVTVQNGDGTVTTASQNTSVAPTVTGTTKGTGVDPNWSPYTTISTWTETTGGGSSSGTGSSVGTTVTGGGSSGGDATTDATGAETFGELVLDDGSKNFGSLTDKVTDSFSEFVNPAPLAITCSNSLNVDPITFDFQGHSFVIWDNSFLSALPVGVIHAVLLFTASILGVIIVFSGGV